MMTPIRVVLLFAAFALSSIAALPFLRISPLPEAMGHVLLVRFSASSNQPEFVENHITSPLENVLSTSPGIRHISSVSMAGQGFIRLAFDTRKDLAARIPEIRSLIRQVYPQLPGIQAFPLIQPENKAGDATLPLLTFTVEAAASPYLIARYADAAFRKSLRDEEGIAQIQIPTQEAPNLFFRYAPTALAAFGLSTSSLYAGWQPYHQAPIVGKVKQGTNQLLLKFEIPRHDTTIRQTPLWLAGGSPIHFGQLGQFVPGESMGASRLKVNGKNAITVSCYAHKGVDQRALSATILAQTSAIQAELPADYVLRLAQDSTEHLNKEIHTSRKRTLRTLGILFFFLLITYRKGRPLLLLSGMIAIHFGLSVLMLALLHMEVHVFTLAGLSIASGMVIDNVLLMLDYLQRNQLAQARAPMAAATLSTLLSLGYVWWLPDDTRLLLTDFSWAIGLGLVLSWVLSWFLLPAAASLLQSRKIQKPPIFSRQARRKTRIFRGYYRIIHHISRWKIPWMAGWLLVFGIPFAPLFPDMPAAQHIDRWIGGSWSLFMKQLGSNSGTRTPSLNQLYIELRFPWGFPAQQVIPLIQPMERLLSKAASVEKYTTQFSASESVRLVVFFKSTKNIEKEALQIRSEIAAYAHNWTGIEWAIYGTGPVFSLGEPTPAPAYRLKLSGYTLGELDTQVQRLDSLLQTNPRVLNRNPHAVLDQDQQPFTFARLLVNPFYLPPNMPVDQIFETVSTYQPREESRAITHIDQPTPSLVFAPLPSEAPSVKHLLQQPLFLDQRSAISASALGIVQVEQPGAIHREERRFVRVFSFVYGGPPFLGERLITDVLAEIKRQLPPGYSIESVERTYRSSDTRRGTQTMLLALLVSIFLFGAMMFNHLKTGLWLSLAVAGSMIGLFLVFGGGLAYFDQGGTGAIILVAGLSVNAFIYTLADFNQHPARKRNPNRALLKAIYTRSPTVLLTTLSSIGGLLPLLFEGPDTPFWYALAAGTMGGLVCSLLIFYFFFPVWSWKRDR